MIDKLKNHQVRYTKVRQRDAILNHVLIDLLIQSHRLDELDDYLLSLENQRIKVNFYFVDMQKLD